MPFIKNYKKQYIVNYSACQYFDFSFGVLKAVQAVNPLTLLASKGQTTNAVSAPG